MSGASIPDGDLREEYDFSAEELRSAERGRYARKSAAGVTLMPIDPDVAEVFPDARSVNQALRAMASFIRARAADDTA